jgi:hypothetical protein
MVDEARLAVAANRLFDERDYLRNRPRQVDALEVGLSGEQPGVPVDLAAVVIEIFSSSPASRPPQSKSSWCSISGRADKKTISIVWSSSVTVRPKSSE